jgi:hypothetical protein
VEGRGAVLRGMGRIWKLQRGIKIPEELSPCTFGPNSSPIQGFGQTHEEQEYVGPVGSNLINLLYSKLYSFFKSVFLAFFQNYASLYYGRLMVPRWQPAAYSVISRKIILRIQ